MTIKALYPTVRPTLNLDFAKTKRLDPRVTFTRASTATFVDNGGVIRTAGSGVPRFDHNPTTGESLGLLVEGAATNAVPSSNTGGPSNPAAGVTFSTSGVGPDGVTSATQVTVSGGPVGSTSLRWTGAGGGVPWSGSATNVRSFYVKVISGSGVIIKGQGGGGDEFTWNLSNLSYFSDPAGPLWHPTGGVINVGNGWYRCWIGPNGTSAGPYAYMCPTDNGTYLFWGFQAETGSYPSSYIPTSGSTATRAADVATLSNTGSSVFPTSAFTTVNSPFGTAGGGSTVKLVGPTIKHTAIYAGDLPQVQVNALTGTGDFWRWRVVGDSFALPSFTTNGSVTVDWGDGVVETLTTAAHTFTNGSGYHDIGFRLNSGTFFKPLINQSATYKDRVIAVGPAPVSMKVDGNGIFYGCTALRGMNGYVDFSPTTNLGLAWISCSSLVEFPLVNTSLATNMINTWRDCSSLTSFPLINTSLVTSFNEAWRGCSGLTSFPLINTGSATSLLSTWYNNVSLTSFPLINTANVTNFGSAWFNNNKLTSFPLINTAAGTNFYETWFTCSSLTSFPLVNTGAGTTFERAWINCTGLTSFPLINTGAGTNFTSTWQNCSGLTSFPLINVNAGTNFGQTWRGCANLTSFPTITFNSATNLNAAWYECTNLATFPANAFNTTGTLVSTAFTNAFINCALTATSIENILTSLVTNGQSNVTLTLSGGTNAGAATWTTAANTAYATLISRGWTIARNA